MKLVKIYGAGSIGNHLAHAARRLDCEVHVCDISNHALERMKGSIYPERYGQWDPAIHLHSPRNAPRGDFDLICIGTPPDSHLTLALDAIEERPRALQVEKPACTPALELCDRVVEGAPVHDVKCFVGYDHAVARATRRAEELLDTGTIGEPKTLDVEFREHWGGIFKAHPWLAGPADSYLGFWQRGGGASSEHSHAINLWQHFAHVVDAGRVERVDGMLQYERDGEAWYDSICLLNLRTESGMVGRVVQDVLTRPVRKTVLVQGTKGTLRWIAGYTPSSDAVMVEKARGGEPDVMTFSKSRPDDFFEELKHIRECLNDPCLANESPIALQRGLDTMLVVAAAHRCQQTESHTRINYEHGYSQRAFGPIS